MKRIRLFFLVLFIYSAGYSQFITSVLPSPDFTNALQKIVLDFRFDFHTIQVDSLFSKEDDHEIYATTVKLPGSSDGEILRFHSIEDTTSAYQAFFYKGDDYNEAVKSYKNCIRLLKKSRMKWIDNRPFSFGGKEEQPDQSVGFTVSTLRLNLDDHRYKDFCAEVEINGDVTGWRVQVSFENKHVDTEDSGQ